jgi:hypothetical protein
MVRLNYIIVSIIIFSMFSCSKILTDDIIGIERKINTSTLLEIEGYYSYEYIKDNYDIYFLFKNGIILYGFSPSKEDLIEYELKYRNGEFYKNIQNIKFHWGVYEINKDIIKFERWYPSEKPYRTTIREGLILNDSTFVITKSYKANGSEVTDRNETYKFRKFSPKPDSTNVFIKR